MFSGVHQVFRGSNRGRTSRLTWVLLLSTLGWLWGWVPSLSPDFSKMTVATMASAQTAKIGQRRLNNYINALVDIEKVRDRIFPNVVTFYSQGQQPIPKNVCRRGTLPGFVQESCSSYFIDSASIVRKHHLTIAEFNWIRTRARADETLGAWIHQQFCLRLPQEPICR